MSVTDHPVSYYQHLDITDPTPYETDDRIWEGEECMICGQEFHKGERIMVMVHGRLFHNPFLFHGDCMFARNISLDTLSELGFEIYDLEGEQ